MEQSTGLLLNAIWSLITENQLCRQSDAFGKCEKEVTLTLTSFSMLALISWSISFGRTYEMGVGLAVSGLVSLVFCTFFTGSSTGLAAFAFSSTTTGRGGAVASEILLQEQFSNVDNLLFRDGEEKETRISPFTLSGRLLRREFIIRFALLRSLE